MDSENRKSQVHLILIRHGATPSNRDHRYLGKTEESLSAFGRDQVQKKWQNCPVPELLLASPMKRCLETAELIWPQLFEAPSKYDRLCPITEWREMDFGLFERKNYQELNGNPDYQAWIDSGGTIAFPGGESREEFIRRCMTGWQKAEVLFRKASEKKHWGNDPENDAENHSENHFHYLEAAAVVHGGTIMALMSRLTGKDYFDFQLKNAQALQVWLKPEEDGYVLLDYAPYDSICSGLSAGSAAGGSLLAAPSDSSDRVADRITGEKMEQQG